MNTLETLISIFVSPMQRLENAMIQLLTERTVDAAVGYQLDVLGRVVGQSRGGLDDDTYRRYIRARVAANRATGKRSELINILRLVLNDDAAAIEVNVARWRPAKVFIRINGVAIDADTTVALLDFAQSVVGAGVGVRIQISPVIPSLTFRFSGGTVTGPGFGDTSTPDSGGAWSDVRL